LSSTLPLNSSELLSSCLVESTDKKIRISRNFGCSVLPYILPQPERPSAVCKAQKTEVKQLACNAALCSEPDGCRGGQSITNFHQHSPKGCCPTLPETCGKNVRKPKYNCIQRHRKYGYRSLQFSNNNQQSLCTSNGNAEPICQENGIMSNCNGVNSTRVLVLAPALSTSADTATSATSARSHTARTSALMSIPLATSKYPLEMRHHVEATNAMFSVITLQNVDVNALCHDTSICSSKSLFDTSMYGNKSTFERHEHSYSRSPPRVRMARTKQTARRNRDDKKRDQGDERRPDERRLGKSKSKAKKRREQSPRPEQYICVFCQKVNKQRTNHKRHLIMRHKCRLDGTPATAADIAQAKAWNSKTPADWSGHYKSREYVSTSDSDSDDDDGSPESSSSSRRGSPSPPRHQ